MKFVNAFTLVSVMFLVLGGGLVGAGSGAGFVLIAVGAGWHALLYATAQRILGDCREK